MGTRLATYCRNCQFTCVQVLKLRVTYMYLSCQIYRKHKEWHPILEWSMRFCNDSKEIFSGPHATQLHLVSTTHIDTFPGNTTFLIAGNEARLHTYTAKMGFVP